MSCAVRYYSRSGNTKAYAEAIAKGAGVEAISIDSANAAINESVDVLYIGGALYAYGIDNNLKEYLSSLDGGKVGKAVVFSTSWMSKHAIDIIKKELQSKGVEVVEESLYAKGNPKPDKLREAEQFAKKMQ